MSDQFQVLRGALAAFPRGWESAFSEVREKEFGEVEIGSPWEDGGGLAEVITVDTGNYYESAAAMPLASFIAAAKPDTIRALLAEVEALRKDAEQWRAHVGKLDALVTYCPTCCSGFKAKPEMTRDEVIFECGKTAGRAPVRNALMLAVDHIDMEALRISHCKDAAVIDAAMSAAAAMAEKGERL